MMMLNTSLLNVMFKFLIRDLGSVPYGSLTETGSCIFTVKHSCDALSHQCWISGHAISHPNVS